MIFNKIKQKFLSIVPKKSLLELHGARIEVKFQKIEILLITYTKLPLFLTSSLFK